MGYLLLEDQAIYMNFFDWMFKTSRKKALQSYNEYWRRLYQYFELFARRSVNDDIHKQMRRVSLLLLFWLSEQKWFLCMGGRPADNAATMKAVSQRREVSEIRKDIVAWVDPAKSIAIPKTVSQHCVYKSFWTVEESGRNLPATPRSPKRAYYDWPLDPNFRSVF